AGPRAGAGPLRGRRAGSPGGAGARPFGARPLGPPAVPVTPPGTRSPDATPPAVRGYTRQRLGIGLPGGKGSSHAAIPRRAAGAASTAPVAHGPAGSRAERRDLRSTGTRHPDARASPSRIRGRGGDV